MKRQPRESAAAFFVLPILPVESHKEQGECVGKSIASTDGFFYLADLY